MNDSRYVLAIDPSGNYKEGQGTTGWCLFDQQENKIAKFGTIKAEDYSCQFQYWNAHVALIDSLAGFKPDVVIEDYLLYSNRAEAQTNSRLETPQLLGIIKYESYIRGLYIYMQTAMQVKTRWNNQILVKKGYLNKKGNRYYVGSVLVVDHIQDSIRHAVHYKTYNSKYNRGDKYGSVKNNKH